MGIKKINGYQIPELGEIAQNKVEWRLRKKDCALLIHDMQEYFVNAYDKTQEPYITLAKNLVKIKTICQKESIPVFYSAQPGGQSLEQRGLLMDFWGLGIPNDGKQHEIIKEIKPLDCDELITKWRYSAFENTDLEKRLKELNRTQLIITGIYTHIGCLTTSVVAAMKNIKTFVIADATADFSLKNHKFALDYVSQLSGMVLDTKQFIEAISS